MGLLREWAERAHTAGRRGQLIERILADPQFERHSLEVFQDQADRRLGYLTEATTSDFADLVGAQSQMQRALIDQTQLAAPTWHKYARIAALSDLKTVQRLRRSDTDRYQAVPEAGEAVQGGFSSHTVEYTPSKFELVLDFTWEMLINDDLGAFRYIGQDLAQGAMNTVNDFVVNLIAGGADIYDGTPLFDPGRGNMDTDALDATSLQAGITALRSMVSERGNPLHIVPGFLLVPPELEFTAKALVNSTLVPGSMENDTNVLHGIVEVIVDPLLTEPADWFLIATPASIATLELGFLQSREAPEVLVKEDFEHDLLSYKGRLVMGGAVLDWRGFYGGLVSQA